MPYPSKAGGTFRDDQLAQHEFDPRVDAYVTTLRASAAQARLGDLMKPAQRHALYRRSDRNGIDTVALRTADLTAEQLRILMQFRLAQYLATRFVDARLAFAARLQHEPLTSVSSHDVHFVACASESGEILCYATLNGGEAIPSGTTLRDQDRPLLPVEVVHGWGVFNHLRWLPDLPVSQVRELGRFVRNQRLPRRDHRAARAPVEVCVALLRTVLGPLQPEVDGIVGDLETSVAWHNLAFCHIPLVVRYGTIPYQQDGSYFFPRYQSFTVYPFAVLCSDLPAATEARLEAIETALEARGSDGLRALFALKRTAEHAPSSLVPPAGMPPLTETRLEQRGLSMQSRRSMLAAGARLRAIRLFRSLSLAEASILATLLERRELAAGSVLVLRGGPCDALVVIEAGRAEVRLRGGNGRCRVGTTLGPGDYVGEVGLVNGREHDATVVAATPMTVLRLSRDVFARYLADVADVMQQIAQSSAMRAARWSQLEQYPTARPQAVPAEHYQSDREAIAGPVETSGHLYTGG